MVGALAIQHRRSQKAVHRQVDALLAALADLAADSTSKEVPPRRAQLRAVADPEGLEKTDDS
jgi:hypothetical protein